MRGWRYRVLALVLGTFVALLLGEGVVRALGLAPQLGSIEIDTAHGSFVSSPNPVLKYVPKPGAHDVNAAGFRDRDYDVAKPPDTYRIVVLGDSIAFGYCNESRGIPLSLTFSEQLEAMLEREPLPEAARTEVLNFSVSGYDTAQEVELLAERALAYEPDLVLVAYCLNDIRPSSVELHLFSQEEGWEGYHQTANRIYRGAIFRSHPHQGHHDALQASTLYAGWEHLDMLPVFQRLSETTNDLCDPCCDIHSNERGHEITAAAIARHLHGR